LFVIALSSIISCSGTSEKVKTKESGSNSETEPAKKMIEVLSPADNGTFSLKDKIAFSVAPAAGTHEIDSVQLWFAGERISTIFSLPASIEIEGKSVKAPGRKALRAVAYKSGFRPQTITLFISMVSDIVPETYKYKVKKIYNHDPKAFTQGLVWDNGVFYEGTGQEGASSLRKVDPETGKVLSQVNLDAGLFGEGIAVVNDRIYQITWTTRVGFVYDKSNFSVINKIYYQTQGWGLTTFGEKLVMSDGTNTIWFLDQEFNVTSSIEVWDNKGKVDNLNELEMVEGELWANIWQTDKIARIDIQTGKVLGYIELNNLLPRSSREGTTDVLNGIAYDPVGKRIFVTGKYWPKLFEIEVIKQGRD
jgi:glutaminyl-peptide cyclotransferase